jgi:hypothetical protein
LTVTYTDEVWPLVDYIRLDGRTYLNGISASEEKGVAYLAEPVFYRDGEQAGIMGRKFEGKVEIVWKQASVLPLSVLRESRGGE